MLGRSRRGSQSVGPFREIVGGVVGKQSANSKLPKGSRRAMVKAAHGIFDWLGTVVGFNRSGQPSSYAALFPACTLDHLALCAAAIFRRAEADPVRRDFSASVVARTSVSPSKWRFALLIGSNKSVELWQHQWRTMWRTLIAK
jgi:hypothetical protein